MTANWWSSIPSTPTVVALAAVGVAVAGPLCLVGLSTVTGWDVVRGGVIGEYWFGLGLLAAGSLFAAPYGAVLGLITMPVAVRTAASYGTPTAPCESDRPRDHVAAAVLYAGLVTFAAGAVLWTVIWLPPGTTRQRLGSTAGPAALLVGGLPVAATFLAAQVRHRHRTDATIDGETVAWYSLCAAGLLPAPFAALVVLDWLVPLGLVDGVILSPW